MGPSSCDTWQLSLKAMDLQSFEKNSTFELQELRFDTQPDSSHQRELVKAIHHVEHHETPET